MEDIQKEIREAIEKNLPLQVGKVLQKELAALEQLRKEFDELTAQYETVSEKNDELNELKLKSEDLDKKETEVRLKQEKVDNQTKDLELNLLKKECEMTLASQNNIYQLVNNLFRNIEFRRSVYGTVPMQDNQGYISSQNFNKDMDEKAE